MMTEMMMRTDDDPNYITTNQTRTRTRMRMRTMTMKTMMMMMMTRTRTRTMTDNKDDNDDHEDLTFLTQQPTYLIDAFLADRLGRR
jgi:hypothetical protein